MKNYKHYKMYIRILFVLSMAVASLSALNLLLGGFVVSGTHHLSVLQAFILFISVVDWDKYQSFAWIYDTLAHALIGLFYILFLIYIIKKTYHLITLYSEVFHKERDEKALVFTFKEVVKDHISVHFPTLLFFVAARMLTGCVPTIFTMILLLLAIAVLAGFTFVTCRQITFTKKNSLSYSVFNTIRLSVMIATLGYGLLLITESLIRTIAYNSEFIYWESDFRGFLYALYGYYTYAIEPIAILIAVISFMKAINRLLKTAENTVDNYSDTSASLRSLLFFFVGVMVVRVLLYVFCKNGDGVEFSLSADFIHTIFCLVKKDALPFVLTLLGGLAVNYGMPAIEYAASGNVLEICN